MRRRAFVRRGFAARLVLLALLSWALASDGAGADDSATPFAAGELLIKLRPRAAAGAPEALQRGFAASLGDADARALDAALAKHGAKRFRKAFPQFEPSQGVSRASAAWRAASLRQRYLARARRARVAKEPPALESVYVLELAGAADVRAAAAELTALPDVVYAEPNWIYQIDSTRMPGLRFQPDDRFVTQDFTNWSEGAWGQDFLDLWGIEKIRAVEAWNAFDLDGDGNFQPGETKPGEGVVVAVVDTGVDATHPEIQPNIWTNPGEIPANGIDDDGNGLIDDVHGWNFVNGTNDPTDANGHGTHVAGTIAAVTGARTGVVGVAPWAQVMPVAGLNSSGAGTVNQLAQAVVYAADNGADIVSASWGGPPSSALADAFAYARSLGVSAVAAAGNSALDVDGVAPASLPGVIAVAALQPDDRAASFTNFGARIDIAAPGTGVLSLNARGGNNRIATARPERVVEGDYLWLDGTSMACPHVSGALAVLLSRFPGASADELRGRLRGGARNVDAVNPSLAGKLGSGALDLAAALTAAPVPILELAGTSPPDLPPSGAVPLVVRLQNFWQAASGVVASLSCADPHVTVVASAASFGDIPTGETRANDSNPFELRLAPDTPIGSIVACEVSVQAGDFARTLPLTLKVPYFEDRTDGSGLPASEFLSFQIDAQDYDGDGLPDLIMNGFGTYYFFRNLGGGRFANAVPDTGVFPQSGRATKAVVFDADEDGDRDIVLGGGGGAWHSEYFENPGAGRFLDRGAASGIASAGLGGLVAVDYDRDGLVDVLGGQNRLWLLHNNGDGTFTDVAAQTGFVTSPSALRLVQQMVAFDYDDDGNPDVVGLTYNGGIFLLHNLGHGIFVDALPGSGIDNSRKGGNALAVGDYDNDGDLDLFVTGIGTATSRDRNALYRNDGGGHFTNVTAQSGDLARGNASGWVGTDFFDFDNDGDLDLFLASEGLPNEVTYHVLYRNDGNGIFTIVNEPAFPAGFGPGSGAAAIFDYDRDGSLDLYVPDGVYGGTGRGGLLRNRIGAANHWTRIDLKGFPRDPYGARVRVVAGGISQIREVHTGVVDPLPLHFGLGAATRIEEVEIRWPDGELQRVSGLPVDETISISEPGLP